jgi:hypothetical protein
VFELVAGWGRFHTAKEIFPELDAYNAGFSLGNSIQTRLNGLRGGISRRGRYFAGDFNGSYGRGIWLGRLPVPCSAADIAGPNGPLPDGIVNKYDANLFLAIMNENERRPFAKEIMAAFLDIAGSGFDPHPDGEFSNDDQIAFWNLFFAGCQ